MFLLINKPKGITSHGVVDVVREITGEKKVGHAGTLDPNATGLLIVAVGRQSTKKLGMLIKDTKVYEAEIYLGEERKTHDVEGEVVNRVNPVNRVNQEQVEDILDLFVGKQEQIPPKHSAVKIKGKKAYELARKGKKVRLEPRAITIHYIKLLKYDWPILKIETKVSSGTYIRSLARDVGRKLEMGAYLKNLKRLKIGKFDVKDAVSLSELDKNNWKKFTIQIKV